MAQGNRELLNRPPMRGWSVWAGAAVCETDACPEGGGLSKPQNTPRQCNLSFPADLGAGKDKSHRADVLQGLSDPVT